MIILRPFTETVFPNGLTQYMYRFNLIIDGEFIGRYQASVCYNEKKPTRVSIKIMTIPVDEWNDPVILNTTYKSVGKYCKDTKAKVEKIIKDAIRGFVGGSPAKNRVYIAHYATDTNG